MRFFNFEIKNKESFYKKFKKYTDEWNEYRLGKTENKPTCKKGEILKQHTYLPNLEKRRNDPGISEKDFDTGYVLLEKNEIVLDVDNEESGLFIMDLLSPFKEKIKIEMTPRGYHFYLKLPINITKSQNFTFNKKDIKVELKAEGSLIFSSSKTGLLKDCYYTIQEKQEELTFEETEYLLTSLEESHTLNIGYLTAKNSGFMPFYDSSLTLCVKSIIETNTLNSENIPLLISSFKRYYKDVNPYSSTVYNDIKIKTGERNNFLFYAFVKLGLNVGTEDIEEVLTFLKILNKEICETPLPEREFNDSFNKERYESGKITFFKKSDLISIRQEFLNKNIYQNLSENTKSKEEFYIIEKVKEKPNSVESALCSYVLNYDTMWLLIRKIAPGDVALMKEIRKDYLLTQNYIFVNPKSGIEHVNKAKMPGVYFINQDDFSISPSEPIEKRSKDGSLILDFSTEHYSSVLKSSDPEKTPKKEDFLEIPYVKLAIENLFGTKEKLALFLRDIRPSIENKRPTKTASILSGKGGIGKDAFIDYIADCFLNKRISYFKDTQDSIRRDSQFTEPLANATIVHLNEAGTREKEIDGKVLSGLNRYIDNKYNTAEAKHKNARLIKSHLLLMVLSTNSGVNIGAEYNNTRYLKFQCPGIKPLRSDDEKGQVNRKYFFKGKTHNEIVKETAEIFINFVLYSDELQKWAENAKDDSDVFLSEALEADHNTEIGQYQSFVNEMEKTKLQNLIDWGDTLPLYYEAKDTFEDFKLRLYINLPADMRRGASVSSFKVLDRNGVPKKVTNADNVLTTLYRIVPWLMTSYRSVGEIKSKEDCKNIVRNGIIRKFLTVSDKIRFSPEYIKKEQ